MTFPNSSFVLAGKYTQIQLIGQGSGGNVYRAIDNVRRVVAVKEALPAQAGFFDTRARFEKEARIHATLKHPKIIQVYHLEEDPRTHELYLICEYANGGSLADHLKAHGPLSEQQAIRMALDICAALEEVCGQRFVHRDIKPSNILLFKNDQGQISEAKLGDFGVTLDLDKQRAGQPSTQRGGSHPGTVLYMPPEQANIANPLDVTADLFAFGISLWEMLTGRDYKLSGTSAGPPVLHTHNPQTSLGIAEVIQRAVRDDPRDRYPTPRAMCADLQAVLDGRSLVAAPTIQLPPTIPPRRMWVALVGAAVLVIGLVFALVGANVGPRPQPTPVPTAMPTHIPVPTASPTLIPAPIVMATRIPTPTVTPTPLWVYKREAEHPDQSTAEQVIQRPNASGSQVYGPFGAQPTPEWLPRFEFVKYNNINIPQMNHLYLKIYYSKYGPSSVPILIFIDNEPAPRAMYYPIDQGNWDTFVGSEPIDLGMIASGSHSIRFSTDGQQYGVADLDIFVLSAEPQSIVPTATPTTP
jgi:serine/threonine protein kinase